MICPTCKPDTQMIGVEYHYGHPHHYDGISEWRCPTCNTRIGRWSHQILQDSQSEAPFGANQTPDDRAIALEDPNGKLATQNRPGLNP